MKVKDQYLKVLKNFLFFNENFFYDGKGTIKTRNDVAYVQATLPDFIDIPIYTRKLGDILKLWTPESDIEFDINGQINYLIIKNDIGTVRYRLVNNQTINTTSITRHELSNFELNETFFKFNLDYQKYSNLLKTSKIIESDSLEIYSIDNNKIGLKTFRINDKDDRCFIIEIEKEHEHTDKSVTIPLKSFEMIMASDYNMEVGIFKNTKVVFVKAFNGNIDVKYLFASRG